jgi:dihydrodipicolinate synthase/N-acetylneuraminate lyase
MLTARDIRGLYAIIPTPAKPHANRLDAVDTVDLAETERLVNALIKDQVSGLIALGTTGECATLSHKDYEAFVTCVLETVNKRIPTFIGATALGGHEVAHRLRLLRERGADGTLLGLPMWQPVVDAEAIGFYQEVSEYFPDLAIMVYGNSRAFRYAFPTEFWEAIVKQAPTVCAAKYSKPGKLLESLAVSQGRINFMPNNGAVKKFYELSPDTTTACWATAACMGPAPAKAMMDAILQKNGEGMQTMAAAMAWSSAPVRPLTSDPELFAQYNIQMEKMRMNVAGYCQSGPMRPPYDYMPPEYRAAVEESGRRWKVLCENYQGNFRFKNKVWLEEPVS